jgi:hypothetical protein
MYAAILIYVWPDNAFGANQKFNTYFHATPYDTIIAFYFQTSDVAIYYLCARSPAAIYTYDECKHAGLVHGGGTRKILTPSKIKFGSHTAKISHSLAVSG